MFSSNSYCPFRLWNRPSIVAASTMVVELIHPQSIFRDQENLPSFGIPSVDRLQSLSFGPDDLWVTSFDEDGNFLEVSFEASAATPSPVEELHRKDVLNNILRKRFAKKTVRFEEESSTIFEEGSDMPKDKKKNKKRKRKISRKVRKLTAKLNKRMKAMRKKRKGRKSKRNNKKKSPRKGYIKRLSKKFLRLKAKHRGGLESNPTASFSDSDSSRASPRSPTDSVWSQENDKESFKMSPKNLSQDSISTPPKLAMMLLSPKEGEEEGKVVHQDDDNMILYQENKVVSLVDTQEEQDEKVVGDSEANQIVSVVDAQEEVFEDVAVDGNEIHLCEENEVGSCEDTELNHDGELDNDMPTTSDMDQSCEVFDIYEEIPDLDIDEKVSELSSASSEMVEIEPVKAIPVSTGLLAMDPVKDDPTNAPERRAKKEFNYRARRKTMIPCNEISTDYDIDFLLENKSKRQTNVADSKLIFTATAVALSAIVIMKHHF